jgi:hypothetical protein
MIYVLFLKIEEYLHIRVIFEDYILRDIFNHDIIFLQEALKK